MIRKSIFALYTLTIACIGFSTIIEKYKGTQFVSDHIYGSWWFVALWAGLTVVATYYLLRQRLHRRAAVMLLHVSFIVILAGALTTYLTARRGTISLRMGNPVSIYTQRDGTAAPLPCVLTLKDFQVVNYPGTDAPLDYQSIISMTAGAESKDMAISMNNIGQADGFRFFQSSYDSDGKGVSLGVYYDPYGIAITYTGYLLLLLGIVSVCISRNTHIRSLYRRAVRPLILASLVTCAATAKAAPLQVVPKETAHRLGTVCVLYNDRICPLNTVATDFVTKLSGRSTWNGYSADEIFASWMIYYSPWEHQPLIRIKSKEAQRILGIDGEWASFSDFIDIYNEYKLKDVMSRLHKGEAVADRKGLMEADEKYNVVAMFYQGELLKMFPYPVKGKVTWYKPGSQVLPSAVPVREQFFIKQAMDRLTESIVTGQQSRSHEIIAKIRLFQREMAGSLLPSHTAVQAEILHNSLCASRWHVFLALTLSLLLCLANVITITKTKTKTKIRQFVNSSICRLSGLFPFLLTLYLTLLLALKWYVSGHVPVSNGYETMLFMAWTVLLITIAMQGRFPVLTGFGSLTASLCMLVAMLAGGSPQVTQLMPVLQSPLLSVHVMTVMCSYALFALQTLLAVQALWQLHKGEHAQCDKTTALSMLLLYPAVFLLAVGIFLGAVWANVSWGAYWSWDPKETWALITMMVYAVPLHATSLPQFSNPRTYHLYIMAAFLSVLTTYFGVNYLLGGMHSYA